MGDAAEEKTFDVAAAAGTHDDQVALHVFGGFDDAFGGRGMENNLFAAGDVVLGDDVHDGLGDEAGVVLDGLFGFLARIAADDVGDGGEDRGDDDFAAFADEADGVGHGVHGVFGTIDGQEDAVVSHTCSLILTLMRLFEGIATYVTRAGTK